MRIPISVVALSSFAIGGWVTGGVHGQEVRSSAAERGLASVVVLRVFDSAGNETGQGSGFVLEDGRVATASHVLEGAAWVEVYETNGSLLESMPHAEALSTRLDLAILPRLSNPPNGLALANPAAVTPGDRIWVVGAPQGLAGSVSDGVVSALREVAGRQLIQITAPISPGSSGGPVLDDAGRLIGVATSMLESGQNLNFAVPADDLRVLASSRPGDYPFPSVAAIGGVRATAAEAEEGDGSPPVLAVPGLVQGTLDTSDDLVLNKYVDPYIIHGEKGDSLLIVAFSTEFDTMVGIRDWRYVDGVIGDADWGTENDDINEENQNSRLEVELPMDGDYLVWVTSFNDGHVGDYVLSLSEGPFSPLVDSGPADGAPTPPGDRWRYVTTSSEGITFWLDDSSIRTTGSQRSVWSLELYPEVRHDLDDAGVSGGYDEQRVLQDFDCANRRRQLRQVSYYRVGEAIESSTFRVLEWTFLTPETVGESLLDAACS